MIRQLKTLTACIVAGLNIAVCAAMIVAGYADRLHPLDHPYLAVAGLVFPVTMAVNMAFLVFWIVFRWQYFTIPVAGFAAVMPPLSVYLPINEDIAPPVGAIKVVSYNVRGYRNADDKQTLESAIEYLKNTGADILCLQEDSWGNPATRQRFAEIFAYSDTAHIGNGKGNFLTVHSRFPILRHERIKYASEGNGSAAFYLQVGYDTVVVINNHLESSHLTLDERQRYTTLIKGEMEQDTARAESKRLIQKLSESARKRSTQADAVATYIAEHKARPIIVCGDFNDPPNSYAHRTIATGLTDCFVEAGSGLGWSFRQHGMFVRIDNILCSRHFQPYRCRVDSKATASDHSPISCWLKKREID